MGEFGAADGAALLAPGRRELPRQTSPGGRTSGFVGPAFIALRYFHMVTGVSWCIVPNMRGDWIAEHDARVIENRLKLRSRVGASVRG